MTTYVLVHGAWHGSWSWSRVVPLLEAEGHRVFAPTLTGVGERAALLSRDVTLETHVADVVDLIRAEDLRDVVLVGHSYGGIVARHVADRVPERILSLLFLDAFVTDDGKSLSDYLPDGGQIFHDLAAGAGEGWKVPPLPASMLSVNAADVEWVESQCTPQPLATLLAPAKLSGACDRVPGIGYIRASAHEGPFEQFYHSAGERGWWRAELPCGHDIMIDMPKELAALLMEGRVRAPQMAG